MRSILLLCFLAVCMPAFGAEAGAGSPSTDKSTAPSTQTSDKTTYSKEKAAEARSTRSNNSTKAAPRSPSKDPDASDMFYCAVGCGG